MSALLDRITDAQNIFGLLRRWSPVFLTGKHEGYRSAIANLDQPSIVTEDGAEEVGSVALDLTDRTGRAHAAWWAVERGVNDASYDESRVVFSAERGAPMTPEHIDRLARLVLRLAGRTP